ncbi:coiled-coil domain-containing protein 33-like [Amphiura filiformis]|uniref:coiled-coil domain-containing protein 33-like n=1 Tax=Amphiura filiformis TaxID=82378 RepID=UPI003B2114B0
MSPRKVEDEDLRFSCELDETIFNDTGKHYVRISVISKAGREKLSKVSVTVGDGGKTENKPTAVTDIVQLTENSKDSPIKFARNKFEFTLPKGTCSEDPKQALILLISVFKSDPSTNKGVKVSGANFDIYPRSVAPLAKLDGKHQELYLHDGLITFTRTLKEEGIQVHAGKTRFSACLEWVREIEEDKPEKAAEENDDKEKSEDEVKDKEEPKEEKDKKTEEEPKKEEDKEKEEDKDLESPRRIGGHTGRGNTVAKAGHVEVLIIVHAASLLPKLPDGAIPKPYVIGRGKGKSKFHGQSDPRVTHASLRPCLAPSWEELVIVEIKTKDVKKEAVHLLIVDEYTKAVLLEYELALAYLKPFHQYHLDLVQVSN